MRSQESKVFAAVSPKNRRTASTKQVNSSKKRERVFVAMSGGVDSSVAALLLSAGGGSAHGGKKHGYDVTGVFMRAYNLDGCQDRDARDARLVAQKIGIPFYVWDFEKEYKKKVVDYMVDGYRRGITPNPDVMCNKEIKFGLFLEKALKLGADYIATGHYVRLKSGELSQAKDKNKDQSYFLWTLTQKQLQHCLFPIGDYLKPDVRMIAKKAGLPTAEKKDSQGICFLGKISLADFLKKRIRPKGGLVLNTADNVVGKHDGSCFYTIGQRHGLKHGTWNMKHGTLRGRDRGKFYVAEKDVKSNTIVVAEGTDNPALYKKEVKLIDVNFICPSHSLISAKGGQARLPAPGGNRRINVFARVRYRQPLAPATLARRGERAIWKLTFDKPQKFVASGQSAVFYSNKGGVLGGGIIQ